MNFMEAGDMVCQIVYLVMIKLSGAKYAYKEICTAFFHIWYTNIDLHYRTRLDEEEDMQIYKI